MSARPPAAAPAVDLAAAATTIRAALGGPARRAVVIGDVMVDRYVDGASTRLSPEAPVPVVAVERRVEAPGGAANAAVGLANLGIAVTLVGVVGDDAAGDRLERMLEAVAGLTPVLVRDPGRPTTTKARVRVDGRHVLRVDDESREPLAGPVATAVRDALDDVLPDADVLLVSDYAKGVVAADLVGQVVARADRPRVLVDPKHPDVERYRGADVLAPNRSEARAAAGLPDEATLDAVIGSLHTRLPGTTLVVTCGADGLAWSTGADERGSATGTMAPAARWVTDVTGAGDSVIAGLAAGLVAGAALGDALALATTLAAVAVESAGTTAPGWAEVEAFLAAAAR